MPRPMPNEEHLKRRLIVTLQDLEEIGPPNLVWEMLAASAEVAQNRLREWRELQEQEFRD